MSLKLKNFRIEEFDSPDQPGSGNLMNEEFLLILDTLRDAAGLPFIINSGYRTKYQNIKDGGKPDSAHLKGLAADIRAVNGWAKYRIIQAAMASGIKRIGIGSTFIHLDVDNTLPTSVIWTY